MSDEKTKLAQATALLPAGFQIVPVEPTKVMTDAAYHTEIAKGLAISTDEFAAIYHTMLTAAKGQP